VVALGKAADEYKLLALLIVTRCDTVASILIAAPRIHSSSTSKYGPLPFYEYTVVRNNPARFTGPSDTFLSSSLRRLKPHAALIM
jgi:hypothetical protein